MTKIVQKEVAKVERRVRNIKIVAEICKHFTSTIQVSKRGSPFLFPIYSFFFSQKSSLISKFKRDFEVIRKNEKDCKKCTKRTSWQAMATNLHGKKVHTYQDGEIRYVFTPIEQSYNSNLKSIFLWTSFGEEGAQENKVGLVGLFEIEWKTPHHNILVEFMNNCKLDLEHNKIKVMLGDDQRVIDKHVLAKVCKICHIGET